MPADWARRRGNRQLHNLRNTLASLRMRLTMVSADPTCRWAQEENIEALMSIASLAMEQVAELGDSWRLQAVRRALTRTRP